MHRNGWILFLILLCVAFFVSCGKKEGAEAERGELVKEEHIYEEITEILKRI